MRCRVFPDGAASRAHEIVGRPDVAAREYAEQRLDVVMAELVVEPADDEARALPGWSEDEDGPFLMFSAVPDVVVTWDVRPL